LPPSTTLCIDHARHHGPTLCWPGWHLCDEAGALNLLKGSSRFLSAARQSLPPRQLLYYPKVLNGPKSN
jgi:hypothetical protein